MPERSTVSADRGGFLPWLIFCLAASGYGYAFFQRVAPGVMTQELMRDLGVSAAALGSLSAAYFYAYAGLQIPVGVILDRWGARWVLILAITLGAAGSVLFGLAETLEVALLGRLAIGAGVATAYLGSLKIAATWFPPQRFALMAGLILPFGMVGAIGAQLPLAALVEAVGWRVPMFGAAGFAALLAFLLWLTRLARPRRRAEPHPQLPLSAVLAGFARALREHQTWLIAASVALGTVPILAFPGLWGVPYLMASYGIDRLAASTATSVMLIGFACGSPLAGWLSQKLQRRKMPFTVGFFIALVGWLALLVPDPLPLPAVYLLFLAIGIGSSVGILGFVIARERVGVELSGSASAIINTCIMGAGALFQYMIGALLDLAWDGRMEAGIPAYSPDNYQMALLTLPAAVAIALGAALLVRETFPGRGTGCDGVM